MPRYTVEVAVLPLPALLDPQGEAIQRALHRLGETAVQEARAGRVFHLTIEARNPEAALAVAQSAAQKLLHNPVVETYHIRLVSSLPAG